MSQHGNARRGGGGGPVRDFYLEHPAVAALSEAEVTAVRHELGIRVLAPDSGDGSQRKLIHAPVASFLQASFPSYLLEALEAAEFRVPTAIQRQVWPIVMSGHDLIGLAETGSGKTLAFLLPALVYINSEPILSPGDGPLCLVLTPTRELAMQVHEEAVRFGHPCAVRSTCVVGGLPKAPQLDALRRAPDMVVATPGRLSDFVAGKRTDLSRCGYLVLDEADRMLDLGFEPQIAALVASMALCVNTATGATVTAAGGALDNDERDHAHDDAGKRAPGRCSSRQTLLFSATWPEEVQALAAEYLLPGAVTVEVGGALARGGRANARIEQRMSICAESDKRALLWELLEKTLDADGSRILVFCSSKRRCEELTHALRLDGWPALALHGDKTQEERDWVLHEFRRAAQPVLVATDVAQRGLDIKDVRLVVNFDCPGSGEAYVHRIGRTARAGSSGTAHTFLTSDDTRVAAEIIRVLEGSGQSVPTELEGLACSGRQAATAGRPSLIRRQS